MLNFKRVILFVGVLCSTLIVSGQQAGTIIDRIIGVVGNQIVKESDMQDAFQAYKSENILFTDSLRGLIYDQLMFKKLLVSQAIHDSLDVTEAEVVGETDRRMRYFQTQFKSEKEFELFYGKSIDAFKFELHDQVKELLLAQKMQGSITSTITVSPADVQVYFKAQIVDSLPFINAAVELGQILIVPPINPESREYTRQSLEEIRQRVLKGSLGFAMLLGCIQRTQVQKKVVEHMKMCVAELLYLSSMQFVFHLRKMNFPKFLKLIMVFILFNCWLVKAKR